MHRFFPGDTPEDVFRKVLSMGKSQVTDLNVEAHIDSQDGFYIECQFAVRVTPEYFDTYVGIKAETIKGKYEPKALLQGETNDSEPNT